MVVSKLISRIEKIEGVVNKLLIKSVMYRSMSESQQFNAKHNLQLLQEYKYELLNRFKQQYSYNKSIIPENNATKLVLTANRLMALDNLFKRPNVLKPHLLQRDSFKITLFFGDSTFGVVKESLETLNSIKPVVGFRIVNKGLRQSCTFFFQEDNGEISNVNFICSVKDQKKLLRERNDKQILILTEGDIAGHAIRALSIAKSLRELGYRPKILASGRFRKFITEEGFKCQDLLRNTSNEGRRLIDFIKGNGRSLFPWDFSTVRSRIKKAQGIFLKSDLEGLDLVISDMDPISKIALEKLGKKYNKHFISLSQMHDLTFNSNLPLRTLKFRSLLVGCWLEKIRPHKKIHKFVFETSKLAIDFISGLPLFFNDPRLKCRLTDYLNGRDGNIIFSFDFKNEKLGAYFVGLQVTRESKHNKKIRIPRRPFILNMQGSTYDPSIWKIIKKAIVSIPNSFSIHATGKKEKSSRLIYRNKEPVGFISGYIDGFTLAGQADLVINHGGIGTMSQWLVSSGERLIKNREALKTLLNNNENIKIENYLKTLKCPSRSISICNTFEQENNARKLNALCGENICSVMIADEFQLNNGKNVFRDLVNRKLTTPIDDQEIDFWNNFINKIEIMNASVQIALLIERKIFRL